MQSTFNYCPILMTLEFS